MNRSSLAWAFVACVTVVLAGGCDRRPAVQEVQARFSDLQSGGRAASGSFFVTAGEELRPVIARAQTVAERQALQVDKSGPNPFLTPSLDGAEPPVPGLKAVVRHAGGEWQPRRARLRGSRWRRTVAVWFEEEDIGRNLDLRIEALAPPPVLDAITDEFEIPDEAELHYGFVLSPGAASTASLVLSLENGSASSVLGEQPLDRRAVGLHWTDRTVSLRELGGVRARLRLRVRGANSESAPVRVVVSQPVLTARRRAEPPYNLVLVSIDTLRADFLGAYGYPRPVSPEIDRLAAGGTLFEDVVASWPETSASHMTLFTGLTPSVHGVAVTAHGARPLPAWQPTLAELLRPAGFLTGAITEDGLLLASVGFRRGFDSYKEFPPPSKGKGSFTKHPIDGLLVAWARGEAEQVFDAGAQWLEQHRNERFFLFLHTYQVHQRAAPGAHYDRLRESFAGDGLQPAIDRPQSVLATYSASIAYTDDRLRGFVDVLDGLDLTRRTVLVVTSDHGEEFFEHGVFGHNQTLYDTAVRVPLIFYCPGFIPGGRRVRQQVGLIDITPTLLELFGLPPPPHSQGRSVAGLVMGEAGDGDEAVVLELKDRLKALRTGQTKLVRISAKNGERYEFYDLGSDPGERSKIPVSGNARAQQAIGELNRRMRQSEHLRQVLETPPAQGSAAAEVDEDTRERLRALGYEAPQEPPD